MVYLEDHDYVGLQETNHVAVPFHLDRTVQNCHHVAY